MADKTRTTERAELEAICADIGRTIASALPRGVGFALVVYDFGAAGNMAYLANGRRPDVVKLAARAGAQAGGIVTMDEPPKVIDLWRAHGYAQPCLPGCVVCCDAIREAAPRVTIAGLPRP